MDDLTSEDVQENVEEQETSETSEEELIDGVLKSEEDSEKPSPLDNVSKQLLDEVTALRAERRSLRDEVADLKVGVDEIKAGQTAQVPEEISPLKRFVKENPDSLIPAEVYVEHEEWKEHRAEIKTERQAEQDRKDTEAGKQKDLMEAAQKSETAALDQFSAEKTGEGLDLRTVLAIGEKHLSSGDKLDIASGGEKAFQIAYRRCLQRTLESGTQEAKLIKQRQAAHKKVAKTKEKETEETTEKETIESEKGDFTHITDFVFSED